MFGSDGTPGLGRVSCLDRKVWSMLFNLGVIHHVHSAHFPCVVRHGAAPVLLSGLGLTVSLRQRQGSTRGPCGTWLTRLVPVSLDKCMVRTGAALENPTV